MSDHRGTRIIGRITRTELASLFGSPIAWFILVVFTVLTSASFVKHIASTVSIVDLYGNTASLTKNVYLGYASFLESIVQNIYIYIPLLTMGLVARETSSGSIKLVYSSPVTSTQFVIGKFLAAAVMGLCLMVIPTLTLVGSAYFIVDLDVAPVLVGLLGIYLQILASCAIGLFFSSLTTYQVVAAVGSLATLAILGKIGSMGRHYELLRNIAHWLSINGRTSAFLDGVFRTDDFFYFIAIVVLFLGLTVMRISFPRLNMKPIRKYAAAALLLLAVAGTAFVSSRPALIGIHDATRARQNSITETSKQVLRQMDGKIVVNNYVNLFDNMSSKYLLQTLFPKSVFEQYKLTKPDIEEHTIYYYDDCSTKRTSRKLASMGLEEARDYLTTIYNLNPRMFRTPEEMSDVEAVRSEDHAFVREIIYDGKTALLRNYEDNMSEPSEAEITAVLAKLTGEPPIVGLVTGNGERSVSGTSLQDYSDFTVSAYQRYALINQGFDVVYTSFDQPIPESIEMLVVADPVTSLSDQQMENFRGYLSRGGNMMILTDYGHQEATEPILRELGLKASDRQIARTAGDFSSSLVLAQAAEGIGGIDDCFRGLAADDGRVTMPGCVALERLEGESDFEARPLLISPSDSWLESDYSGFKDDIVECDETDGEVLGSYVTAYALSRGDQRIIVVGDADCLSNSEMTIEREGFEAANYQLIIKGFQWISGGRFPVRIDRIHPKDTSMRITTNGIVAVRIAYVVVLPVLILAMAVWVLMRRRRA
ncbi:MAG: Gldg family protein [Bacteroidales bacterium]|nr:Gldg family protein [Bacteroidales bacterium]